MCGVSHPVGTQGFYDNPFPSRLGWAEGSRAVGPKQQVMSWMSRAFAVTLKW